jgi:Zn-dependent protease
MGAGLLACPSCGRLVHADELKRLAADAEAHERRGENIPALSLWRQALVLLPRGTRQFADVHTKIEALSRGVDEKPKSNAGMIAGLVGSAGLFLWKFKTLLLGLTKLTTLLSMAVAFLAYWQLWGMKFALGFVLAIYVHEMGHVVALTRRGMAASAPMFIPGLGAFVRLNQYPIDVRENARVGLAGPIWGTGAALAAWGIGLYFGGVFTALARAAAWLNLFNLLPFGSLDGGRGVSALSRMQRIFIALAMGAMWAVSQEVLLLLLAGAMVFRATNKDAETEGDFTAFAEYLGLVWVLGALCLIPLPK